METKKLRIYLADTEEDIANHFASSDKFTLVGKSAVGSEVVNDIKLLKPDFLVMEVLLSGMDGFMVMETLKKEAQRLRQNMEKSNLTKRFLTFL